MILRAVLWPFRWGGRQVNRVVARLWHVLPLLFGAVALSTAIFTVVNDFDEVTLWQLRFYGQVALTLAGITLLIESSRLHKRLLKVSADALELAEQAEGQRKHVVGELTVIQGMLGPRTRDPLN